MDINSMTLQDFYDLPYIEAKDLKQFGSIIILPAPEDEELHDSGYRCMWFIPCISGTPIGILRAWSDVINFDGIGGYGKWSERESCNDFKIESKGWTMDCLVKSDLLHIMCNSSYMSIAKPICSNFELYADKDTVSTKTFTGKKTYHKKNVEIIEEARPRVRRRIKLKKPKKDIDNH